MPAARIAGLVIALAAIVVTLGLPLPVPPTEAGPDRAAVDPPYTSYLPRVSGSQIYRDDFSNPASGWVIDATSGLFGYVNDEYRIIVQHELSVAWVWPNAAWGDSYRAEVDARAFASTSGLVGITFAATPDGAYIFLVGGGNYELLRYQRSPEQLLTMLALTPSPHIRTGNQVNRLKVIRNGSQIALYANDQLLTSLSDSTLGSGYVGVAAGASADNFEARFDNFFAVFDPNNTWATGATVEPAS